MVSLTRYWCLSTVAASAVVYHAFATRQHFYPTCVYLSTSKLAVAAVGNLAFATAMLVHRAIIKIFLGSLRDIEQELIRERLSSAIMESLLALTIFREEFSGFFVAMFATLVFIKVLHWLVQDRVDYIEVTPSVSRLQHVRIVSFMLVLLAIDAAFLQYTVSATIASGGQSVMLLFAFEYVIQATDVIRYFVKYVLSMLDLWLEGRWESKSTCVFYMDLITDLLHLFIYVVFFTIVFFNYGLPLHLVRDLYSTFRNFRNRVADFLRFRQVSARLDRLPDASAEDLSRSDGVCIICREEMTASGTNKKLFCGHVFHLHCLRSWLERQQNCPTCRGSVFQRRSDPAVAAAAAAARAGAAAPAAAQPAAAAGDAAAPAADAADGVAAVPDAAAAAAAAAAHNPFLAHGFHLPQHHRIRLAHHHHQHHARGAGEGAAHAPNPLVQLAAQPVPPPGVNVQLPPALNAHAQPGAGTVNLDAGPLDLQQVLMGMPGMGNPLGMPTLMPLYPTLMPPLTPMPNPNSVIEQQAAAAAAAAALAAAAAVGAYNPMSGLFWLPPAPVMSQPAAAAAATAAGGAAGSSATAGTSSAQAAGTTAAGSGSTDDLTARIARLTGELNTVLTELNALKQQALAKQVAEQMQQAIAAAQAQAAASAASTAPVPPPTAATSAATATTTTQAAGSAAAPAADKAEAAGDATGAAAAKPSTSQASDTTRVCSQPAAPSSADKPKAAAAESDKPATPAAADAAKAAKQSATAEQPAAAETRQSSSGAATASAATATAAGSGAAAAAAGSEGSAGAADGSSGDASSQDEIRRKRLAKFGQSP